MLPTFRSVIVVLVTSVEIETVIFFVPLFRFPSQFVLFLQETDSSRIEFRSEIVTCVFTVMFRARVSQIRRTVHFLLDS